MVRNFNFSIFLWSRKIAWVNQMSRPKTLASMVFIAKIIHIQTFISQIILILITHALHNNNVYFMQNLHRKKVQNKYLLKKSQFIDFLAKWNNAVHQNANFIFFINYHITQLFLFQWIVTAIRVMFRLVWK